MLRVISVRVNYLPASTTFVSTLKSPKLGYISRYALNHDYHKFLRSRLKKLGEMIQQHCVSLNFGPFIDSTPIPERPLAERVGLGWAGKHSLILNREAGSFFFLGESLVDIPLPMDQPAEEGCGRYVACMTVCPTGAVVESCIANARRCTSYSTIELEGVIPEELWPLVGNRTYGCDDCQLVYPWNRYSQFTAEDDFSPRGLLHASELIELFAWSEEKFLRVTEGSTIRRIGHLHWLCNIAVALGNTPWDGTVLATLESREGERPLLDEHMAWTIAQQIERRNACMVRVQLPKK